MISEPPLYVSLWSSMQTQQLVRNRFLKMPTWVDPVRHLAGHPDIDCGDGRDNELAAPLIFAGTRSIVGWHHRLCKDWYLFAT